MATILKERRTWLMVLSLVGAVILAFWGVARCGFIDFDDPRMVVENPSVRNGLTADDVHWAWTQTRAGGYWMPLTWMSLQLDGTISRALALPDVPVRKPADRLPDAPPPWPSAVVYHVHNLLLHMVGTVLLFLFLIRTTKVPWAAFWVALFWAIHPLRVESVAWVVERKDVLAGVFGFLTMNLYLCWVERGKWWRYGLACLAFALSLMCKMSFVSLPFLLVILDGWPLGRIGGVKDIGKRLAEKWGLLLLAGLGAPLMYLAQAQAMAVTPLSAFGLAARVQHALVAYVMYLVREVQVWNLAVLYPPAEPSSWEVVGSAAILVLISAACLWQIRRRPWLLAGWLWFLGTMFPWIGIVQAGPQETADRFTYLPAAGLFVMVVFGIGELRMQGVMWRREMAAAAVAFGVFLMVFTWRQVGYWQNTFTIADRALQVTEKNEIMHFSLSMAHLREGENAKALEEMETTVAMKPQWQEPHAALGHFYSELGEVKKAILELAKAAQIKPRDVRTRRMYAAELDRGGFIPFAIHEYQVVVTLDPGDEHARRRLAALQAQTASRPAP